MCPRHPGIEQGDRAGPPAFGNGDLLFLSFQVGLARPHRQPDPKQILAYVLDPQRHDLTAPEGIRHADRDLLLVGLTCVRDATQASRNEPTDHFEVP